MSAWCIKSFELLDFLISDNLIIETESTKSQLHFMHFQLFVSKMLQLAPFISNITNFAFNCKSSQKSAKNYKNCFASNLVILLIDLRARKCVHEKSGVKMVGSLRIWLSKLICWNVQFVLQLITQTELFISNWNEFSIAKLWNQQKE